MITVYSAISSDGDILRMSLHPMDRVLPLWNSTLYEPKGKYPFRVIYFDLFCGDLSSNNAYYSCRGKDVASGYRHLHSNDTPYAGNAIGDSSIDAGIAWLLEGEK